MKKLKIYYTSDVHGYLYPTDYLSDEVKGMGLMQAIVDFHHFWNASITHRTKE